MVAGARTFGIGETFIEAQALPPPPTRHALLAFLVVLASILQLGTAGWSEIHNGAEGDFASAARSMARAQRWATARPPLAYWLTAASYKIFGVNATAARLPSALATVAAVALTFLIGERLGNYWRGFVAGLIHLCSLGSFVWPRLATAEPLSAACLGATIFCAVCGYQRQRARRLWFAAAWVCAGLLCLTKGPAVLFLPASIFLLPAVFFREARVRFRSLLSWPNVLVFLALVGPWLIWRHSFGVALPPEADIAMGIPLLRFFSAHLAIWFPATSLILPAIIFGWRKIFRPNEFDFAEALPLFWMAAGLIWLLLDARRGYVDSIPFAGAFALVAAAAWERAPGKLRQAGIVLTAAIGVIIAFAGAAGFTGPLSIAGPGLRTALVLAGFSIVLFAIVAAHFSARERETLAIVVLLLGMAPIGMSVAEGMSRFDSYFSLANAARFLQPQLGQTGEVLFEGSALGGSSLDFYLDRPARILAPAREQDAIVQKLSASHPVYLVIDKDRSTYWQERLTAQFHFYHQETTCGTYVIVSNQP